MRIILTLLAVLAGLALFAQGNGKITGNIKDGPQKNLQSATIALLRAKDSSTIKFSVTNKDGYYEFVNVKEGKYLVSVTLVGFEKSFSQPFEVTGANPEINVAVITLTESAKSLGGVTVTAKKPFIETKIDKTIVNVEASPGSAGATAMEVLEKSPGIAVDNDGNISLKGKAGVIIMMDGKPTYLSAADLATLLKNLPASALEQIEIMTNPSSKYDASGNSGVINIKTKKGKTDGFNGSIMFGASVGVFKPIDALYLNPRLQSSFTFNYRKNKINLFGNYNPNFNRSKGYLTINRRLIDENYVQTGYSDVETNFRFGNFNQTLKLGLDYFADKKNTYGVVLSGFMFNGHPTPVTTTTFSDLNYQPSLTLTSRTENKLRFRNLTSNFNYRHVFDTTGQDITVDLDYIVYDNTSNMTLATDFYDGGGQQTDQLLLRGHLPSRISIYSLKSDYTRPFKKGGRLEAGIKSSYVKNDNLVDYKRMVSDKWVDDARSNQFVYDENINAAYLNVNGQLKKWSLQGGLRVENTIAKGYQVTNDSTFKRSFTNLFPSAFISYTLNKKNTLTVSYSRRITRRNYQDLNPFIFFLDSFSYRKGNPFLLPQFSHNFELSHSFMGKLITTLNYNTTSDVISQIFKPDPQQNKLVYFTADNVAKFTNIGIAITAPVPVTKWWNLNLFTNVYRNHYNGLYSLANRDTLIDMAYVSFMINMSQTFTIKHGFTIEISGFYRAKGVDQLNINLPMYQMSIAGQKSVMKGKGTLRVNIRDPFAWQKYSGYTRYGNVDVQVRNRFDARSIGATFTYRFGKTAQQNQQRRRSNATQDEQNRVGGANQ